MMIDFIKHYIRFERSLNQLSKLLPNSHMLNLRKLIEWSPETYQKQCRCYLDEYPEQEELRKKWFEKLNLQKSYRKLLLDCFYSVEDFMNAFKPEKTDTYFERRWLRRN